MSGKLNLQKMLVPLTNMGLRGVGLVGRFALSFYLVKFLSLSETGQFGLIVGVAGVLPALFGFGMNYFLSREIIGVDIEDAFARIRDKMVVMASLLGVTLLGALAVNTVHPVNMLGNLWLAGLIIVLEVIAFDLHIVLISLRKPLLANFLLIVRSAAWVFPFIGVSFLWPQYRNLDTLLVFWLASLVLSFLVLWLFTRTWPWLKTLSRRIDSQWIGHTIKAAGLVYLSDLGLVVYSYFDRFFIAGHLGLAATGVYTFYWTMANALLVLITAAVVQVSLPGLVDGFKAGEDAWRQRFGRMLVKALAGSLAMAVAMYGAVTFLMPYIGNPELSRHPLIFPLMLLAIVVKIVADMTHYGLYSRKKDRTLALVNISGIVVNLILTFALVTLFGLIGVGVSMLGTAAYLLMSRGWFLYRDVTSGRPAIIAEERT
ncbi:MULTISPECIES: lipopolysaccharide biosynthesis protein [Asticcacaulis]|uniref:lipopolysaccharide biosynthesis protein n=1 Tax=Asticcacaulis TaxID=76890 RepID=UPI001AEA9649|nr:MULTISPECIES: lipopolysaccharide biosynthesis protein [Asticcacaulis]MBP2159777.1 O-antigen/teichoic acid export membrane protein [Asticcacaulis solisilvae]MDR6800822.1 O-antigen/teichoic acid export membrane protein [Asticcacaulis sp. BE141]